jgi:acyl-CoA synthetase (AMP-forming)/AMP-acid ligase II
MHLGLVLEMTADGFGSRTAISVTSESLTFAELAHRSWAAARWFDSISATSVTYLGDSDLALPIALFGAASAGIPFVPLNYRLGPEQLTQQIADQPGTCVLYGTDVAPLSDARHSVHRDVFVKDLGSGDMEPPPPQDPQLPCLLLSTSGTTSAPKATILRHRHLMAYLLGTLDFGSAGSEEGALISAPPYHIAGTANLLSNLYAGRRVIYLKQFSPEEWLSTIRSQELTQAMVVPTMLARVVEHLGDSESGSTPSLRVLSYGGSRMPTRVLQRSLALFPNTDFVNAYGLTETSSTIALLGPDDHRNALDPQDSVAQRRLGSVGRMLPGIEVEVRDPRGTILTPGEVGLLYFRGDQISGEYQNGSALDGDGWFSSRDLGHIDADGYLFVEGRADDTIIRGGENIAPLEIEDVLLLHPGVADAVVVGTPDDVWGQRLAAVVVLNDDFTVDEDELRAWVRDRLRSSKTPDTVAFWPALPRTETGKLVRREVLQTLVPSQ